MKVLLTSCGLETKGIESKFKELLSIDVRRVKALFIPTAAVNADAINVLPKCMNDLLKCGILKENIAVYDLHRPMSLDELLVYDVIYICGGNTEYLLDRMNENDFSAVLKSYIRYNKLVLGVSAGSIVFAQNLSNNLGLLHQKLNVHCNDNESEKTGKINLNNKKEIMLGNSQGMVLESEESAYIIE